MAKAAFLGLGVMAYPMAGHLKSAGHTVTVYYRTVKEAGKWAKTHAGNYAMVDRLVVPTILSNAVCRPEIIDERIL